MEETKKYVKKAFAIHQFEKEEQFLMDMEKEGWRFCNLEKGFFTVYEFEKAEPKTVTYQLDYIRESEDTAGYQEKFEHAGYEQVYRWEGQGGCWYYFRKEGIQDEPVMADSLSMAMIFNQVWMKYALFLFLFLYLEYGGYQLCAGHLAAGTLLGASGIAIMAMMLFFGICALYFAYHLISIYRAQNKAKKRAKNS